MPALLAAGIPVTEVCALDRALRGARPALTLRIVKTIPNATTAIAVAAAHVGSDMNPLMAMNTGTAGTTAKAPSSTYRAGSGSAAVIIRVVIPRHTHPDRDTGEDDRDRDESGDDHEPSPAALRASEVLMMAADVSN